MIDASKVNNVLVGNQWVSIEPGTFALEPFYFASDTGPLSSTREGFKFTATSGDEMAGPLESIQAVQVSP